MKVSRRQTHSTEKTRNIRSIISKRERMRHAGLRLQRDKLKRGREKRQKIRLKGRKGKPKRGLRGRHRLR